MDGMPLRLVRILQSKWIDPTLDSGSFGEDTLDWTGTMQYLKLYFWLSSVCVCEECANEGGINQVPQTGHSYSAGLGYSALRTKLRGSDL